MVQDLQSALTKELASQIHSCHLQTLGQSFDPVRGDLGSKKELGCGTFVLGVFQRAHLKSVQALQQEIEHLCQLNAMVE